MNANEATISHMKELIKAIKEADLAYYKYDRPTMSDRAYDALFDELKALEASSGLILSGSPTQTVAGTILEELTPVRHSKPMLSADKTKSVDDLIKFAHGHAVLLAWKMDGLTLVLRYDQGRLQQAITRGSEGVIGEDVTHTVRTFLNVPLTVPSQDYFEVRGEGVISWDNFQRLNATLDDPYTLPRSLAAGSTRKLDANESRKRFLEFMAFELIKDDPAYTSKEGCMDFLAENGFTVVPYLYLGAKCSADHLAGIIALVQPKEFDYPVDGLIIEYDDLIYGKSLGATGHHENRMLAFKWEDELSESKFLGVELATTRTGMVSITGLFEPVEIDGATVSRAYLHNLDIYDEFKFGVGDTISVYKANQIIPQIADNKTQSNTYQLPMTCPCCGQELTVRKTSGGTRQLFCENPGCSAKLVRRFVHFCEKTRMNIEGLSELTLAKFISHGWIGNFADLYTLGQHRDEIIETDGFGVKSYERLQASIEKSRHCTLAKFIAGLGITMVGRHAGRELDRYFHGSWEAFEAAINQHFDFTQLPDFGQTMHDNIYAWYADAEEAKLWRPLLQQVIFEQKQEETNMNTNNPFYGKTVVATGKLQNYTRDGIQNKLLSLGAKPAGSVSKSTDFLIVGESAGSKLEKARSLGVATLSEAEFEAMLEEGASL